MKSLLSSFLNNLIVIFLVSYFTPFLPFLEPLELLRFSIILSLFDLVLKPILSLLFTPINLITLGLLSWIPASLSLYAAIITSPQIVLSPVRLPSLNLLLIQLPPLHFGRLSALIFLTLLILSLRRLLKWLAR